MKDTHIYDSITESQIKGKPCPHCNSCSGHYSVCPLINREVAEARSATLSKGDVITLHALGVRWE